MKLSNKLYDVLKFIAIVGLPAVATAYLGLGQIWHWPDLDKVGASVATVNTCLGALLHLNTSKYNRNETDVVGDISITGANPDTGLPNVQLSTRGLPHELVEGKKFVKLKVGDIDMSPSDKVTEY